VTYRRHNGMVSSHEHEAPLRDLVDPLLGQVVGGVARELRTVKHRHHKRPLIYKLTSPSGKAYVGQTTWPTQRWSRHRNDRVSGCRALSAAISKYGWKAFKKEILLECKEEELNAHEVRLIRKHNTLAPAGYNLTKGGDLNPIKQPEVYARVKAMHASGEIKAKQKAGWTKEVRARMSAVHKARCKTDGGRARKQGMANLKNGNATKASNSAEAMAKRKATWAAKRAAKGTPSLRTRRQG